MSEVNEKKVLQVKRGTNFRPSSSLANSTKMKILLEKGDTKEQIMMAEAMLANKMVSAIETVIYSCQKV